MELRDTLIFAASSYVPRKLLTRFMGWFSKLEQPLIRDTSMAIWRRFETLDLSDAADGEYRSLHDVFTRALRPGARPFDPAPDVVASPSEGIVVGMGDIDGDTLVQAKGQRYSLAELLDDDALALHHRGGSYVTLRLTPAMYHRFHAPHDCQVEHVTYVAGDTWNTHPAALARVSRLYCKNERAIIRTRLTASGVRLTLVPVAAMLVASIRLHFVDVRLHLRYVGPNQIPCRASVKKGDEMGWFEHGSTIVVVAPKGVRLCDQVRLGARIRAGEPLFILPPAEPHG